MGKSERGQGVAWHVQGVGGVKQAGWRWPARGQQAASTRPRPSGERREMTGIVQLGWAVLGQARPGERQVQCPLFLSVFVFYSCYFVLI